MHHIAERDATFAAPIQRNAELISSIRRLTAFASPLLLSLAVAFAAFLQLVFRNGFAGSKDLVELVLAGLLAEVHVEFRFDLRFAHRFAHQPVQSADELVLRLVRSYSRRGKSRGRKINGNR